MSDTIEAQAELLRESIPALVAQFDQEQAEEGTHAEQVVLEVSEQPFPARKDIRRMSFSDFEELLDGLDA